MYHVACQQAATKYHINSCGLNIKDTSADQISCLSAGCPMRVYTYMIIYKKGKKKKKKIVEEKVFNIKNCINIQIINNDRVMVR